MRDAGADDSGNEEVTEPGEAADADVETGEEPDEPVVEDADVAHDGTTPEEDGGLPVVIPADGSAPPVVSAPVEVMTALCSDAYDSVKLMYSTVTRGSWQFNPGGSFVKLTAPGYPCRAFLEEKKTRPADDDKGWTDAADGAFLGFSEPSKITSVDYSEAQFRYFRSYIYIPKGANLSSLTVRASNVDDSVYLELTNTRYPMGISPKDVGPSDADVGACQGNGSGEWNLAKYLAEDEINVVLLVHADLAAMTSALMSVEVQANGTPIQLVSCKK